MLGKGRQLPLLLVIPHIQVSHSRVLSPIATRGHSCSTQQHGTAFSIPPTPPRDPSGADSQEARARAPPPHPHSVPATLYCGGLPEEGTEPKDQSFRAQQNGLALGSTPPPAPPQMWPILRKGAQPGFDSRRGAGFSARVQGGGRRRCGADGARAIRRPSPPRPPRTCVRFTGPPGPLPLVAPSLS